MTNQYTCNHAIFPMHGKMTVGYHNFVLMLWAGGEVHFPLWYSDRGAYHAIIMLYGVEEWLIFHLGKMTMGYHDCNHVTK